MGAVVVDEDQRVVSVGFNGFARGVADFPERYADRELKLRMIIHAEVNCILFAYRKLNGCTLYTTPFSSCARCAPIVIQSGIKRCVAPVAPISISERWSSDLDLAAQMFAEAGVSVQTYEP